MFNTLFHSFAIDTRTLKLLFGILITLVVATKLKKMFIIFFYRTRRCIFNFALIACCLFLVQKLVNQQTKFRDSDKKSWNTEITMKHFVRSQISFIGDRCGIWRLLFEGTQQNFFLSWNIWKKTIIKVETKSRRICHSLSNV